jgi:hypothetical protein
MSRYLKAVVDLRASAAAFAACAILASGALPTTAAPAAEASAPRVVSTEMNGNGLTMEATIDPEGLTTTYEIRVECPSPSQCLRTEGELPAVHEDRTVSLPLGQLLRGHTYWFIVAASNADGYVSRRTEALVPSLSSPCPPNGCTTYIQPYEGLQTKSGAEATERGAIRGMELAKQRQAEQQAREAEASQRAEAAAHQRATEEAQAAARKQEEYAAHFDCVVPVLRGDTLAAARRALSDAHCRLDRVRRPRHPHRGTLVVTRQTRRPGERLAPEAEVSIVLAVDAHRRRA